MMSEAEQPDGEAALAKEEVERLPVELGESRQLDHIHSALPGFALRDRRTAGG
jgi:hypothetical protein